MFKNYEQSLDKAISESTGFKNISRILKLFIVDPDLELNVRAISKRAKYSLGKTSNVLKMLEKMNFVKSKNYGRTKMFKANWNFVQLNQLKRTINIAILMKALSDIFPFCKRVILFGSQAKGTDTFDSDIDLFIETNQKDKVNEMLKKINLPLTPQVMNFVEYIEFKKKHQTFAGKIEDGIVLWKKEE